MTGHVTHSTTVGDILTAITAEMETGLTLHLRFDGVGARFPNGARVVWDEADGVMVERAIPRPGLSSDSQMVRAELDHVDPVDDVWDRWDAAQAVRAREMVRGVVPLVVRLGRRVVTGW